jgi:hypothetical protein
MRLLLVFFEKPPTQEEQLPQVTICCFEKEAQKQVYMLKVSTEMPLLMK